MKDLFFTRKAGYLAADGRSFYFSNCGSETNAKEECCKYESSAAMIVIKELTENGVLFKTREEGAVNSEIIDESGKIESPPQIFYFDEDVARFFHLYDELNYIFVPNTKEDVEKFMLACELRKSPCNRKISDIKLGETYCVGMEPENEWTFVQSKEEMLEVFTKTLREQFLQMDTFVHPENYVYCKDEKGYRKFRRV